MRQYIITLGRATGTIGAMQQSARKAKVFDRKAHAAFLHVSRKILPLTVWSGHNPIKPDIYVTEFASVRQVVLQSAMLRGTACINVGQTFVQLSFPDLEFT